MAAKRHSPARDNHESPEEDVSLGKVRNRFRRQ